MCSRYLLMVTVICSFQSDLLAQDKQKAKPTAPPVMELSAAEQAFVDQLTKATLVGRFNVESRPDRNPQPERYAIESVKKTGGNNWIVQARITYGKYDIPVPVPVQVMWAGDTPVLQVTDLKIPLMGEGFTARVMFYKNRYAGSWYHGKVGGHMWGEIEKKTNRESKDSQETTQEEPSVN